MKNIGKGSAETRIPHKKWNEHCTITILFINDASKHTGKYWRMNIRYFIDIKIKKNPYLPILFVCNSAKRSPSSKLFKT